MELITEMQATKVTAPIVGTYHATDTVKESTRNRRQTAPQSSTLIRASIFHGHLQIMDYLELTIATKVSNLTYSTSKDY